MFHLEEKAFGDIQYYPEVSNEPVHFCRKICLETGVTLLFDDKRGLAEGSDGKTYYPVCKVLRGTCGDVEVVGWSATVMEEVILPWAEPPSED